MEGGRSDRRPFGIGQERVGRRRDQGGDVGRLSTRVGELSDAMLHAVDQQLGIGPLFHRCLVGPCPPVHRHDQVVAGSRAGHIEKPDPFVEAHLLVDGCPRRVLVGLHVAADAIADPSGRGEDHFGLGPTSLRERGHPGHDRDRELEALGAVDGHDAEGVVIGLGQHGLGHPRSLGSLQVYPGQVLPEIPPVASFQARAWSMTNRIRRQVSRGRPSANPRSMAPRSRLMRSRSSEGASHGRSW